MHEKISWGVLLKVLLVCLALTEIEVSFENINLDMTINTNYLLNYPEVYIKKYFMLRK